MFFGRKDKMIASVLATLMILTYCFFLVFDPPGYAGFPLFNLFLMPMLLIGMFNFMMVMRNAYKLIVIVIVFASNILFLPIHFDGTRVPNWGNLLVDGGEYTYPYDKAIGWLSMQPNAKNILVIGHYYPCYGRYFYFNKHYRSRRHNLPIVGEMYFSDQKFDKDREIFLLDDFFMNFIRKKVNKDALRADTILYHSTNNIDLDPNILYGGAFKLVKKFSNYCHSLYVLRRVM